MNIAVITHYYPPEPSAAAIRVRTLVETLKNAGHAVTVVTNYPSFPNDRFLQGPRPIIRYEAVEGVRVVRLASALLAGVPGARLLHWISAAFAATLYALLTRHRFQVIVISSPPITLALPGLIAAARHRARLVVDVRDVFPDIAIAMGQWKRKTLLVATVEALVRVLYRRADLIAAVTQTARSQIAERGVDPARLVLVPNAAERSAVASIERSPEALQRGFTAIYAGNLGLATDVDLLVDAAGLVASDGITLEIVGAGAQQPHLEKRIRDEGITNVHLRGSFPRDQTMRMVAAADVAIVPLRPGIEESVPTKLYDCLAVGCPVILAAEGEAKREASELGALYSPAGNAVALAGLLRQLSKTDSASLRALGRTGRSRVESRADRSAIMAGFADRVGSLS